MATRFYLPSTGTAGASPTVSASWDYSVSAFIRRATVTTKISSAFATISLDGNTDTADTDYCYVQWVSEPIAAQTISAQTVDWVVSLFEENARANQYLACTIRVVSGDGGTVRGTVVALRRDGTELGTSQSSRYDTVTSTEVIASAGDRIVIEIGTGGNPEVGSGGDSHDSDVRIGDNSATDFGESGSETADYCGWVEFANTLSFNEISGTASITLDGIGVSAQGTVEVVGTASITLDGIGLVATGTVEVVGTADITLDGIGVSAQGTVEVVGTASITLDGIELAATGTVEDAGSGSADITLDGVGISAQGTVEIVGTTIGTALIGLMVSKAPTAYWPMDETSGTTIEDDSGNDLDGTCVGAVPGQVGAPGGGLAPYFDGVDDRGEIYSAGLAALFSGVAGTMLIWRKTLDTSHTVMRVGVDASNVVEITQATSSLLMYKYQAGGVLESIIPTVTVDNTWMLEAITWDKPNDQVKAYHNRAQVGTTQTGLGTWAGTITDAYTDIGLAGIYVFAGSLAHAAILPYAATLEEIQAIYDAGMSITLDGIGVSAQGTVEVVGTASITLEGIGVSAQGTVEVVGTASITLEGIGVSAQGTVEVVGTASITLEGIGVSAQGTVDVAGVASITLDGVVISALGTVEVLATASITLEGVSLVATGTVVTVAATVAGYASVTDEAYMAVVVTDDDVMSASVTDEAYMAVVVEDAHG